MIDLSHVTTEQIIHVGADPGTVWDLVTDLSRTPSWNRETLRTVWVAPHTGPAVGAVFTGTNRVGDREWTVECHVIECERPRSFEWTVLDPDHPSSTWWYRLEPDDGGTTVHHGFQHGPGFSFLRKVAEDSPEKADAFIEGRLAMLGDNMRHTLGLMKAVAEAER